MGWHRKGDCRLFLERSEHAYLIVEYGNGSWESLDNEQGLRALTSKLSLAAGRAEEYNQRSETLKTLEDECETLTLGIAEAEEAIAQAQKALQEAQEQYLRAKKHYDSVRNQHVSDTKGREALQFMQTLQNLHE